MQRRTEEQELMIRYLLGELDEAEQAKIEEQIFAGDDYFEQLCLMEDELVDAFILGDLSADERVRLEKAMHFSNNLIEEVRYAERLINALSQTKPTKSLALTPTYTQDAFHRSLSWFLRTSRMRFAIAATILMSLLAGSLLVQNLHFQNKLRSIESQLAASERRGQELRQLFDQVSGALRERDQSEGGLRSRVQELEERIQGQSLTSKGQDSLNRNTITTVSLSLLGLTRGETAIDNVTKLRANTPQIRFVIELFRESPGGAYRVTLHDSSDKEIFTLSDCKKNNGNLVFILPSKILAPGYYWFSVRSKTAAGEIEAPAPYRFKVL